MSKVTRPRTHPAERRHRGVVAVQVAVLMVGLAGFAALTIDVGGMYAAKADLQRAADAAALGAASKLAAFDEGNPTDLARTEAQRLAGLNAIFGRPNATTSLAPADIEFGRAVYNAGTGSYDFSPTMSFPDAIRVRVRLEKDSPNGALSLHFARIFGYNTADIAAEAIAMMVPRDIAIVADLSGSHTDDSELRNYKKTGINLFEVWDGFPGGIDDPGSSWVGNEFPTDGGGYSPQMAGPAWGLMKTLGYGTETIDGSYNPAADAGLIYLPKSQNWNDVTLSAALANQGYIQSEIDAIMSKQYDGNGAWDERTAVALGLARWDSGQPGGLWEQLGVSPGDAGNGNGWVGSSELTWQETFGTRSVSSSKSIWRNYINSYMNKTWTQMYKANHAFKYRFGVKTFINYLMERRPSNSATWEFANAPTQPMQAVKDAVDYLATTLVGLRTDDRLSLEIYGTTALHEVDLTADYQSVSGRLAAMQAAHYNGWTNMGGGIVRAIEELTNTNAGPAGARQTSRKVIFLLTDGRANVTASGNTGDYTGGANYAREMAAEAASQGIRIFSVSVGSGADQNLMAEIAAIGSGTHFHAQGSINTYSAQLQQIFQTLGGTRPVELIK